MTALPADYAPLLMKREDPSFAAGMAQIAARCAAPLPQLLVAFRTGTGVPYASNGSDLHESRAGKTLPLPTNQQAQEWIPFRRLPPGLRPILPLV